MHCLQAFGQDVTFWTLCIYTIQRVLKVKLNKFFSIFEWFIVFKQYLHSYYLQSFGATGIFQKMYECRNGRDVTIIFHKKLWHFRKGISRFRKSLKRLTFLRKPKKCVFGFSSRYI